MPSRQPRSRKEAAMKIRQALVSTVTAAAVLAVTAWVAARPVPQQQARTLERVVSALRGANP